MVEYYRDNPNVTVIIDRREGPTVASQDPPERRQARDARPPSARAIPGTFPRPSRRRVTRLVRVAVAGAERFQNYIGGEWVDAASRRDVRERHPRDRRADRRVPALGAEDVDRAVAAAKEAFEELAARPGAEARRRCSSASRTCSSEHKEDLTDLMSREMGKVKAEAGGDVQEAIDMSLYMAGEGRRLFGQTTPSELPRQVPDERPDADRRRRRDHAVELPDRDPVLEDRARRSSAATRSSSSRPRTRRCSPSGSSSCSPRRACPRASSTSCTGSARRSATRSSSTRTSR